MAWNAIRVGQGLTDRDRRATGRERSGGAAGRRLLADAQHPDGQHHSANAHGVTVRPGSAANQGQTAPNPRTTGTVAATAGSGAAPASPRRNPPVRVGRASARPPSRTRASVSRFRQHLDAGVPGDGDLSPLS